MIAAPIKILILEDDETDIDLLHRTLKDSGLNYTSVVVRTRETFKKSLIQFAPDIILSDFSLPVFDGLAAFRVKQKKFPHIPFIIVSGTIGEENAVELIKSGVTDYVLKDKLLSLPHRISRALKDAHEVNEKKIADEKLIRSNRLYAFVSQVNQNIIHVNDEHALFHNACCIALEFGKFKLAWIGLFDSTSSKITLVDHCGIPEEDIKLFIDAQFTSESHQDYVLRSETYYISNDVGQEDVLTDWQPFAAKHGIKSCIVLPVTKSGKVIGSFNLYASEFDFSESEEIKLLVGLTDDISFALDKFEKAKNHMEAERKLVQSDQHHRALIENITDAIILMNSNGEVTYQSSSVERISGFGLQDLKGKSVFEYVHPSDLENCFDFFQQVNAQPGVAVQNQFRLLHKEGYYFWIEGTIINLLHDENVKSFIINYRDISERKRAEENLVNIKHLLTEAQYLAKIGNWNFDVIKNELYWSDSMRSIYGVSHDYDPGSPRESMSLLYYEDRERVWKELMEIRKSGISLSTTYRIVRPDTCEIRIISGIANAELNENGVLLRMYGIVEDSTELKFAQEERDNTLLELEQRVKDRTKELSDKNRSIQDSIIYAKRLQKSIFPDIQKLKRLFSGSFLMSLPSDIVGGDFFWFTRSRKKILLACVDSTGHGVPGAFMSIIGIELLNKIVVDQDWKYPSLILELIDDGIMNTLQEKRGDIIQDGMDMAFCMIDIELKKIYFAGANLPIILVRNGSGTVHIPSRFGIGKYMDTGKKRFETKEIDYMEGDMLYMFSDGFRDQFGGEKNKKMGMKALLALLEEIALLPMINQKEELNRRFLSWKGNNSQVDDVMVVGIEL